MATQPPSPRRGTANEEKPLTNPADLIALLSRFVAANILFAVTVTNLLQGQIPSAIFSGVLSILFQFWTVSLWRKLRDQRVKAKAERAARLDKAAATPAPAVHEASGPQSAPAPLTETRKPSGHIATARNSPRNDEAEGTTDATEKEAQP